jgi:hypothetical protein
VSRSRILGSFAGVLALASALAPIATASPATAGTPATVSVRAESLTNELVATTLTTTRKAVVKDGDAQHGCSGTSAAGALQRATGGRWSATWFSGLGYAVSAIDGVTPAGTDYWTLWVNGTASQTGLCDTQLQRGDDVLLFVCHDAAAPDYACKNRPLALVAPKHVRAGRRAAVRVVTLKDDGSALPAAGATVRGAGAPVTTDAAGIARVVLPAGQSALAATRSGDVRSAVLHCTTGAGSGRCGGSDRTAPAIAVKGIRNGQRFAAKDAPRTLHGTATDPSGASVQLRLGRSVGSTCSYFDAKREAFRRCGSMRAPLFSAGDRANWSYLLPQRLPAGRYVLGVKATDHAGNADSLRLRFTVAAGGR